MRKLVFGINLTIDGCCDHTKGEGNEDVHEYFARLLRDADTLLYGRKTYELMIPYWPDVAKDHSGPTKSINDFADAFASIEKIVVCSRTMDKLDEKNTRIISGNLEEEILKLKRQPGGIISTGGVDIPSQLIALGLVDEYHFVIQPIMAGAGRRFLDETILQERLQLKLVDIKVFASGYVALKYVNQ